MPANRNSTEKTFLRRAALVMTFSLSLVAVVSARLQRSSEPGPASELNPQQRMGKILYLQNCTFCHSPKNQNPKSTAEGKTIGPLLKGVLTGPNAKSEQAVRAFILKGVAQKMPGFQYGLEPKEIDSLIAYLKTL